VVSGDGSDKAPAWVRVVTAEERPDLWQAVETSKQFARLWPEYNHHGNHAARYFGALVPAFAHLQLLAVDRRSDRVVARARTMPFRWEGTRKDLPLGVDDLGRRALDDPRAPTALSALAAEVDASYRGCGLSGLLITAMAAVARSAGLAPLVAPLRPTWKERYPLIPIERYARWHSDGVPFDPWIRTHVRLGGAILGCAPKSLEITAGVEEWASWTAMAFPDDGLYVFPGGLAPVRVKGGIGHYHEPNVWVLHELR
jgi:GNAT superfamily N-acetyltransferase